MKRPARSLPLAVFSLLAVIAASCGGSGDSATPTAGGEQPNDVTFIAKTSIDNPTLSVDVNGDFVAPNRDAFFQRTGFGERIIDESLIVIGGQAWLRTGDKFGMTEYDDLGGTLDLSPGQLQFWSDFPPSDLAGVSGPREKFNGVDALRISFSNNSYNLKFLAKLINSNETDLIGLQELTIWLEEKDRWPVGFRAVFDADETFLAGEDQQPLHHEHNGVVPDNAPPKLLNSYHYGLSFAAKKETDESSSSPRFHVEYLMAISQVNDKTLVVNAPE